MLLQNVIIRDCYFKQESKQLVVTLWFDHHNFCLDFGKTINSRSMSDLTTIKTRHYSKASIDV